MFVPTKDLPDIVRAVLEDCGFHKGDIDVEPAEKAWLSSPYGQGYQTFAVGIDIAHNRISREVASSWGGSNMFSKRTLDEGGYLDLPPGTMLVMGQRGGGRPVSAKLYAHPDLMAPFLQGDVAADLSLEDLAVLYLFAHYKAFAREETALRAKLPFKAAVGRLLDAGLLKQNKAGALQITTAGKSLDQARKSEVRAKYRF